MTLTNFIVKIINGNIIFKSLYHEELYKKFLHQFNDKEVYISIEEKKSKRSDEQNNYYWAYLNIISKESGHSPNELHEWAKGMFLSNGVTMVYGKPVWKKKSSTSLSKGKFAEYIAQIEAETGVPAPDPDLFYGYEYH